jgi:hypothetical protein
MAVATGAKLLVKGRLIEVQEHTEIPFGPNDVTLVRVNHERWNFRGWSDAPTKNWDTFA